MARAAAGNALATAAAPIIIRTTLLDRFMINSIDDVRCNPDRTIEPDVS
jgi:hypothetical protein